MRQAPVRPRQGVSVKMPSPRLSISLALLVAALCFVCGCARAEQPKEQLPPAPTGAAPPLQMAQLSSPKADEVQEAVKRVFKEAALIDSSHNPNFITGDFNGDDSPDIAVILKPAPGKLSEMNEDSPPWILRDLRTPAQPGMPPLHINGNEVLLAVIHGYGPAGWRDPQASQTYLLKNAVGSDVKTHSKLEFLTANQSKTLPRLSGDLIGEVLQGKSGYLYFAVATYSWYDPKTFKGEPEKRLIHPGTEARTEKPSLLSLKTKKEIAAEK
jgi:hypothetical protein